MFRSDAQVALVCCTLLERANMRGWWTEVGPTNRVYSTKAYEALSHGEQIMLDVALGLWNSTQCKKARLADLIVVLDQNNLQAIGSLLVAISCGEPQEIDSWLRSHPRPEQR